jgi:hypothetical protein
VGDIAAGEKQKGQQTACPTRQTRRDSFTQKASRTHSGKGLPINY